MTDKRGQRRTPSEWVGANVRLLREERGFTQAELADLLCELGLVSDSSRVSKIENGREPVDVNKLGALADALDVTVDVLMRDPMTLELAQVRRLVSEYRRQMSDLYRAAVWSSAIRRELERIAERSDEAASMLVGVDQRIEVDRLRAFGGDSKGSPLDTRSGDFARYLEYLVDRRIDVSVEDTLRYQRYAVTALEGSD